MFVVRLMACHEATTHHHHHVHVDDTCIFGICTPIPVSGLTVHKLLTRLRPLPYALAPKYLSCDVNCHGLHLAFTFSKHKACVHPTTISLLSNAMDVRQQEWQYVAQSRHGQS